MIVVEEVRFKKVIKILDVRCLQKHTFKTK